MWCETVKVLGFVGNKMKRRESECWDVVGTFKLSYFKDISVEDFYRVWLHTSCK